MNRLSFVTMLLTCIIFFNCCNITTLYPIFTEKDIIFSQRLLGSWKLAKNQKDSDIEEITRVPASEIKGLPALLQKVASKGYLITSKDQQQNIITRHLAFLVSIGSYQYLDYYPLETDEEKKYDDFFKKHYIKMHSFYRVDFRNDQSFELKQFDEGFIHHLIDTKQIRIRHESQPYLTTLYIITASTEELQGYLTKYADNPQTYTLESSSEYIKLP